MALDGLGLGVYEETEVDGEYADVGLDPSLMTSAAAGVGIVEESDPAVVGVKSEIPPPPESGWPSGFGSPAHFVHPHPEETAGSTFGAVTQSVVVPPVPDQLSPAQDVVPPAAQSPAQSVGRTASDMTENAGKLFLGGISWQTDEHQLHSYFGAYGTLVDVAVMRNKQTGVSRGFGFVTFADPLAVDSVLAVEHQLDGRRIDIKRAVPRDRAPPPAGRQAQHQRPNQNAAFHTALGGHHHQQQQFLTGQQYQTYGNQQYFQENDHRQAAYNHHQQQQQQQAVANMQNGPPQTPQRKLFVGGLAPSVTEPQFREYFASFGNVVDAVVMFDRATSRSRGFGFVTFSDDASIRAVLSASHELQGKYVEVKSAEPRWVQANNEASRLHHQQQQQHQQQHHHNQQQANHHYQGQQYGEQSYNYAQQYAGYPNDQTGYQAYGTGYQEQDPYSDQRNAANNFAAGRYDPYMTYQHYTQQQPQQQQQQSHRDSGPAATNTPGAPTGGAGETANTTDQSGYAYERGDQQQGLGAGDPYSYGGQHSAQRSNTSQQPQYQYAPDPFYRGTANAAGRGARAPNRPGVAGAPGAYRGGGSVY